MVRNLLLTPFIAAFIPAGLSAGPTFYKDVNHREAAAWRDANAAEGPAL